MRKHNYDNIDDKMLNFETIHKTMIKMNNATKILKKLTITINSENQFKHLIENSQFLVSSFINKIGIFTFSMTKSTFETEIVNQLIQILFDLIYALRVQIDQFFAFAVSINYFRNVFNAVVISFNSIFFEQIEEMRKKDMMIAFFVKC